MKHVLGTFMVLAVAGAAGAICFAYSGIYNVAATDPHWPISYRLMETVRLQSIKAHAAGIMPPSDLGSHARIVAGTAHFVSHCAVCHSAPGVAAEDMAEGMYPKPPLLTDAAQRFTPGELFWIVKNGIKMSGMPSWADHGDDELWNAVAFLERMPGLSEQDYAKLVAEAAASGGHHMHGGAMPMNGAMPMDGHMPMNDGYHGEQPGSSTGGDHKH